MHRIKLKTVLYISLTLNILLIGYITFVGVVSYIAEKNDSLFYAELQAMQEYYCGEGYEKAMRDIDNQGHEPDVVAVRKHVYAMTVCLRNYKTGDDLDLTPLTDQVNRTEPVTNIK